MKILASLGLSSDLSGSWTWARLGEEQSPSLIFRLHHQPGGFWECWAETHWHTVREKWKHRFTASDKSLVFIGVRTVQMDTDLWPSGVRTSLRYSYVRKYRPLEGTSETEMERETVTPLNLGSPQLLCSRSHNTVTQTYRYTNHSAAYLWSEWAQFLCRRCGSPAPYRAWPHSPADLRTWTFHRSTAPGKHTFHNIYLNT